MSFFQNIITSVMKGTRRLNRFRSKGFGKLHNNINKAVDSVMSTSGEVSSLVFAEHLLNLIEDLDDNGLKKFLNDLSSKTGLPVKVVSDQEVSVNLDNYELLVNTPITKVKDLAANCSYYFGCDSFCAILSAKQLPKENLFIKRSPNFTGWNNWLLRAFMPHSPEEVKQFYSPSFSIE
jgi:hypothetical protein